MVGVCRSGCVGRLFSRNRVVSCRSGLVVLEKYEVYIEACSNQAVLNLSGNLEVQVQIAAVRVRVHVGPSTPLTSGTPSSTIGNDICVFTFPLVPGGADTNKNRPTEAANNLIKRVKRVVLDFRRFRNDRARPALPGQAQLGSTRRDYTQLPFDSYLGLQP